jgi:hypothetical protein
MGKFARSWALLKCSLRVIADNKKLLVFPIVVAVLTCLATLFFILPIVLWDTGHPYSDSAHWNAMAHRWIEWTSQNDQFHFRFHPAGYVLIAVIYLFSTFLATFFNVALYSQIIRAFRGEPVSFADGFATAFARLKAIVVWSLFTGLIGILIRAMEERVGIVGRWIISLLGIAWSVASIFVVPAIILEPQTANPVHYLKTSASLLKRTWGESLIGFTGLHLGGLIVFVGSLLILGVSAGLSIALGTPLFIAAGVVLWLIVILGTMYLLNVAGQVYLGALYLYAADGTAPSPFNAEQMDMAWKHKKKKRNAELTETED